MVGDIAKLTEAVHEVGAESQIRDILERASPKRRTGLLGKVAGAIAQFDASAARQHLAAIHQLLILKLPVLESYLSDLTTLRASVAIQEVVLSVLADMTDHGSVGDLVVRKSQLFAASLQEIDLATRQAVNIQRQVQDWCLRCDEASTVTLPALGFRHSVQGLR